MHSFPPFKAIGNPTLKREEGESYTSLAERRLTEIGIASRGEISDAADQKRPGPLPVMEYPEDVIPHMEIRRTQAQIEMDNLIDQIDVLDAYDRWIGKKREQRNGRDHNIMVSCPLPSHPDSDPSASVSFRKNNDGVWACHKCSVGGDKYDLAAIHFGYPLENYKNKDDFPALRMKIAEELGYRIARSGESEWLEPVSFPGAPTANEEGESQVEAQPQPEVGEVTDPDESEDSSPFSNSHPTLDWRLLHCIEPGSFLHGWLNETAKGDEPEEFYLGLGFMALAAAVGNQVRLADDPMVRPNLLMTLVGTSGTGKSIAVRRLDWLLRQAFPWSKTNLSGVRQITGSGSGEDLVSHFDYRIADPNGGPPEIKPVNGLINEDEMASLATRMKRIGSTMRQYLMALFDSSQPVSTSSRTHGAVEAEDHFMQLITTVQPGALRDILSGNDAVSGYLNRWMYIFGNVKLRRAIREAGMVDMTDCVPLLQKVRSWSAVIGGRVVKWNDPNARLAFEDYYHKRLTPLMEQEDAWLIQRADLMAKKLCLLFAINDHSTTVTPSHVESMTTTLEWLLEAYGAVDAQVGATDRTSEAMEIILDYLRRDPDRECTVRELKQYNRRLSKIAQDTSWSITAAIKNLVAESEITELPSKRTTKYSYNDQEPQALATVTPIISRVLPSAQLN